MRTTLLLNLVILALYSCSDHSSNLKISDVNNQSKKMTGKKFFEYDEITYYHCNCEESKIEGELFGNQKSTERDSLKIGIITGDIPKDISDLSFIEKLEQIGYTKHTVDKSNFADIDSIFIEKQDGERIATACMYIYRDILIFKKQNRVIGTAKICFACMDNQIRGTTAQTDNFGQDEDYIRLKTILRK